MTSNLQYRALSKSRYESQICFLPHLYDILYFMRLLLSPHYFAYSCQFGSWNEVIIYIRNSTVLQLFINGAAMYFVQIEFHQDQLTIDVNEKVQNLLNF